ncbi:MAG: QueT transporter family protein, partial [Lachnospiraceae bacterium]|nr:QueT transporter family protein [Lachnospiraceae bacterium]
IVILTAMFALPPIVSNAIIIPPVLKFALGVPDAFWFILVTVTAGEVIACGIFGGILMAALLGNPYTRGLLRNDVEVKAEAVTAEAQR